MFLTNVLFNRRESPCVLRSQSGQFDRVAKPGVETSANFDPGISCGALLGRRQGSLIVRTGPVGLQSRSAVRLSPEDLESCR
jgi:hypothetical protein